jgi:purine-binding chemotaxis protein CheW
MNEKPKNPSSKGYSPDNLLWNKQAADADDSLPLPAGVLSWGLEGASESEELDGPSIASVGGDESAIQQSESKDTPRETASLREGNGQAFEEEASPAVASAVPGDQGDEESESKSNGPTKSTLRSDVEEPAASADNQDPAPYAENVVAAGGSSAVTDESAESVEDTVPASEETLSSKANEEEPQPKEEEASESVDGRAVLEAPANNESNDLTPSKLPSEQQERTARAGQEDPTTRADLEEEPLIDETGSTSAVDSLDTLSQSAEAAEGAQPVIEDAHPNPTAEQAGGAEEEYESYSTEPGAEVDRDENEPAAPEQVLETTAAAAATGTDGRESAAGAQQTAGSNGNAENMPSLDTLVAEIDQFFEESPTRQASGAGPKESVWRQEGEQHIVFSVAGGQYAIPVGQVIELSKPPEITSVPSIPSFVLGVSNVRGEVISVLDLAQFLGFNATDQTLLSRMLVVRVGTEKLTSGFLVDEVEGLVQVDRQSLREPTSPIKDRVAPFLKGVCEHEKQLLNIMDFGKVLQSSEFRQLAGA